jgi:hypothetical protein
MASALARYYDRFGSRKGDAAALTNRSYAKGAAVCVLRRGKVKYTSTGADSNDFSSQQTAAPGNGGIARARKEPVIVVPISKTKPVISTF